ncbi:MAG: hypothetical protein SGPRY_000243, partial [Prymnesium sp.]
MAHRASCALRCAGRRVLSSGVGRPSLPPPLVYAGGLLGAALAGVGIGLMIPTPQRPEDEWREKKRRLVERWEGGKGGEGARGGEGGGGEEGRRHSTVYEDAREIADEIPRPAMIRDVERSELESRYEFISCLASGGSATVWKAVERESGRLVAIKVVDKKLLPASLLNMEVHSMQRCAGHPNIVQLLAAYELEGDEANPNGEWHLVMELAEGGELFERLLQHGAYTEKVASQLMRQAAKAIYHLHSCGIAHRDIKPENMVLMSQ